MATFEVTIPIVGFVGVTVEADSKEAAIKAAFDEEIGFDDILEWETVRHVTTGNICYAPVNDAYAEKVSD